MVDFPWPPSNDFFSSKRRFINVDLPEPVSPNKRILINTGKLLLSSLFINIS